MANRIEIFEVTVPAGTAVASPFTAPTTFDEGAVDRVEILVPPGPSGLVGFQITHSDITVIPRESSKFIVADNEVIKWDLAGFPVGSMWGIRAYNTDVYDHTLYVRYLITEVIAPSQSAIPAIDVEPEQVPAPIDELQPGDVPSIADLADTVQTGGIT